MSSPMTFAQDGNGNNLYPVELVQPMVDELLFHTKHIFSHLEVCGYIRRGQRWTTDIGIVSVPVDPQGLFFFSSLLASMPTEGMRAAKLEMKERRATFYLKPAENDYQIHVDWHFLDNEQQFEVMKLVRTGSYKFLLELEGKAKEQGLYLRHGGKLKLGKKEFTMYGLFAGSEDWDKDVERYVTTINPLRCVAWKERDIIEKVFGHYIEPSDRSE